VGTRGGQTNKTQGYKLEEIGPINKKKLTGDPFGRKPPLKGGGSPREEN